jgi:hypothetical protein
MMKMWLHKLRTAQDFLKVEPELAAVFATNDAGAPAPFLNDLVHSYPWLDNEYLEFLSITDGIHLMAHVLYGSDGSRFPSLHSAVRRWKGIINTTSELPIGADPSGGAILLRKSGDIFHFPSDPPEPIYGTVIASRFSELIDMVFMGSFITRLFDEKLPSENPWLKFLRQRKWI